MDAEGTRQAIETILRDPAHPAFGKVLQWADERGWGKEAQAVEGGLTLTVVRRDESNGASG